MLIVDAQVHLWGKGTTLPPHRATPYLMEEALRDMDAAGVDRAVLHPPSWDVDSNELSVEAARAHRDRFAILGRFALDRPESRALIEGWKSRPGMLGLRFTFLQPHQKSWPTDGTMDWLWPAAEKGGLPVALLATDFLPLVGQIAERHPGLKLIVDHMGAIRGNKGDAAFANLPQLLALAKLPNIAVKATGGPSYATDAYPFNSLHKPYRALYDAFGPRRMFWGTDITRMPCSWRECVTHFAELPWLPEPDKELIMGRAICDWIGWEILKGGKAMDLVLDDKLKIGVITIHRRTEPAVGPWLPSIDEMRQTVELIDGCGYDSLWCGDHISFPMAILDPLLQLAQAAVVSRRLMFGTSVYLLPLRHPVPVAKQVATLDHLSGGRFIFGVGVGGEFPNEYASCGVPIGERGPRLTEAIPLLRKLWSGEPASHQGRYYGSFENVPMQPPARQPGGPPIWCGGRSDGALARAGRLADGWIAYVVTPEMYKAGLDKIAAAAKETGRGAAKFGTGHLLFTRLDDTYEKALDAATATLSQRYAMDFRRAAERYAALGSPQQVADRIRAFHTAGVRHLTLDLVGPYEERDRQIEGIARDVLPLLADLR